MTSLIDLRKWFVMHLAVPGIALLVAACAGPDGDEEGVADVAVTVDAIASIDVPSAPTSKSRWLTGCRATATTPRPPTMRAMTGCAKAPR